MSFKGSFSVLLTLLIAITCIQLCKASYGVGGNTFQGNNLNLRPDPDDCHDFTGRKISHGSHYVPAGLDICKMCRCENGSPKSCRPILCQPPSGCRSFQMTSACCEFICLDKKEPEKSSFTTGRVITLILASILILVILFVCLCRFQYLKKEVEKRYKKMKSKRDAGTVEEAPASIAFSEDLYVKMSCDMITKNDEIDTLKRQISILEDQLDGEESAPTTLKKNEESWKNLYDLHVDIKDSPKLNSSQFT